MPHSILIVDDEALTLRTIGRALTTEGYEVLSATSGEDALKIVAEEKPDLALLDVVLPGINGIEVLRQAKKISPAMIVVMMSAYHMVDRAVEAMKLGAYDYLIKPFHLADMVNTIQRAEEMLALRVRVHDTVETAKGRYDFGRLVTQSPAMREVLEMARRAAESDHTTILIQGESGTGKEVLAKAIHYNSPRAQAPMIGLNCAALPDTLLESELFGYEPGAFTDARRRKEGLIEKASRRDWQYLCQPASQAVTDAGGAQLPSSGRYQADPGRRANYCRNQQSPEGRSRPRRIPRGPVLSPERSAIVYPAPARTARRHSAAGARHHAILQQRAEEELCRLHPGRRRVATEISLAGKHSRTAQRDRAHHDSVEG
jgi:DNA-binding response OmpR family regulator